MLKRVKFCENFIFLTFTVEGWRRFKVQFVSNDAVCRTARATLGLLNRFAIIFFCLIAVYLRLPHEKWTMPYDTSSITHDYGDDEDDNDDDYEYGDKDDPKVDRVNVM